MITRIVLDNFGKKTGEAYDLSRLTVFEGNNESGKSTVFDAISFALCDWKTKGNPSYKRLASRYGALMASRAEPAQALIPEPDWFQFHALEARDSSVPFADSDAKWLKAVKAKLLSGGLDYDRVLGRLEEFTTTSGTRKLPQKRKLLAERARALEGDIAHLESRLAAFEISERDASTSENRYREIAERKRETLAALSEKRETLAALERSRALAETRRLAALFSRLDELEARALEAKPILLADESFSERILNRKKETETSLALAEARRSALLERLEAERVNKRTIEDSVERLKPRAEAARRAIEDIDRLGAVREWTETSFSGAGIAAGAVGAAAAAAVAVIVPPPFGFILAGAALALGISLLFILRKKTTMTNEAEIAARAKELFERWQVDTGSAADGTKPIRETLERSRLSLDAEEVKRRETLNRMRELEDAERLARTEIESGSKALKETLESLAAWHANLGARDEKDFFRKREIAKGIMTELGETGLKIDEAMKVFGIARRQTFRERLLSDLELAKREASLGERPENPGEYTEYGYESAKSAVLRLERENAAIADEETACAKEAERNRTRLETSREGVPETMVGKRRELEAVRTEILAMELERKAASACAELFAEASTENDSLLASIRDEVASLYSSLTGEPRSVEFGSLDFQTVKALDAGGELRDTSALSVGTKDSFILSMRLALAFRITPKNGVFLFDEPFRDYDKPRMERSARALAEISRERNHQFILFTKDGGLAEALGTAETKDLTRVRL